MSIDDKIALRKEAFVGAAAGALKGFAGLTGRAGKVMVKHPMKTLGVGLTGAELASGAAAGSRVGGDLVSGAHRLRPQRILGGTI